MQIYKINTRGNCYACGNRVELGVIIEHFEHSFTAIILCSKCVEAAQHRVQADGDYCECVVKLPPLDLGDGMGACPSCNRPRR